jgi:hypothetical protein
VFIEDDCGYRNLLVIDLIFITDNEPPEVHITNDSCRREFEVTLTEERISDWGIKNAEVTPILNCKVFEVSINEFKTNYRIEIEDSFKDAIYFIEAVDSLGHITSRQDTIQGFTLEFPQFESSQNVMDYEIEKISTIKCDTLILNNSGLLPFTVNNIYVKHNIHYGIPKANFPLIINPGDSVNAIVCFQPTNIYEVFRDTLIISFNCLNKYIALEGIGDSLLHYGDADCGVVIKTVSFEIEPKYFLDGINPNPVYGIGTFNFGLSESGTASIEIYDLIGNKRMTLLDKHLDKGTYKLEYDLSELSNGMYFYVIRINNNVLRGQFVKI